MNDQIPAVPADPVSDASASIPAMPSIRSWERNLWPTPLAVAGKHPAIGWQFGNSKGTPCFAVLRATAMGNWKVLERFPLTPEGWDAAWQRFAATEGAAVEETLAELEQRAAADRAREGRAALDAATTASAEVVTYAGGYGADPRVTPGQLYDLRFLENEIAVVPTRLVDVVQRIPYSEVEDLEIGGPGIVSKLSRGQQAGAAALFGLLGAAVAYGSTRIQTVIHIQATDVDLYFLCTTTVPDALRIQLAGPLGAIRHARAQRAPGQAALVPGETTIASELDKLAGLLDRGLLTREEFNQFKARLLAGS